jgi:spermidine synthase
LMISTLKKIWLWSTSGEIAYQAHSPINGRIVVKRDLLGYRVQVNNLTQSGGQVAVVWNKGLKELYKLPTWLPNQVLLLGLGAGSNAKVVSRLWPKSQMVGVELDPIMVEIGNKYFGLGEMGNLTIHLEDALDYTTKMTQKTQNSFDLILVDLYQGEDYPSKFEGHKFLSCLATLLCPKGVVIFNCLFYGMHKPSAEKFLSRVQRTFPNTQPKKIGGNLLIYAS